LIDEGVFMSKPQPSYTPEFRQQMVDLVLSGRSPLQLSKEFGCHQSSIQSWVRIHKVNSGASVSSSSAPSALSDAERLELAQLRREVRQLRTERDILSKATAWFANNGAIGTPSSR
jgi:transposase